MVCGFVVTIETAKGLNVMNIKRPALVPRCFAASLASETVSLAGRLTRPSPSWPTPVSVPTKPSRAVLSVHIPRLSLPSETAINAAENVLFNTATQSHNRIPTIVANIFSTARVLRVIRTSWGVCHSVFADAGGGTKVGFKSFGAANLPHYQFPAVSTWDLFTRAAGVVTASSRTIFLSRMITWGQERLTARGTNSFLAFATRLVGTPNRAKSNLPIGPFFDRIAALFTLFHTPNYSID